MLLLEGSPAPRTLPHCDGEGQTSWLCPLSIAMGRMSAQVLSELASRRIVAPRSGRGWGSVRLAQVQQLDGVAAFDPVAVRLPTGPGPLRRGRPGSPGPCRTGSPCRGRPATAPITLTRWATNSGSNTRLSIQMRRRYSIGGREMVCVSGPHLVSVDRPCEVRRQVAAAVRRDDVQRGKRSSTPPKIRLVSAMVVSSGLPIMLPR